MNRAARFLQSRGDFPVMVELGREVPAWGLSRWKGGGIRFVPPDDEGFTRRSDNRRLVYKGGRRSHRFTILGDTAFEYDCILEREPESNTVMLRMEGAERFDFFRQPDFVQDPFLKGSYAVYKKETLIGEGTGKLCHIHRPEIIDSRGRRCWGDLSITGDKLCITLPEKWLSEAKYPVIVDPTIGTTTVGSQYLWDADPPEPWIPLYNENCIPVNRFPVNETINGLCTAYFYVYSDEEGYSAGYPVLYSDNNNTPLTRRSTQESYIDLQVKSGKPAGWRSGTMRSNGSIASGNTIWFGISTEYYWYARFDYGSKCYRDDNSNAVLPNTYPLYHANYYDNFKLSMYFTYSSGQNHTRTLTQGVTLTDSRKTTEAYQRNLVQTVKSSMSVKGIPAFIRKLVQQAGAGDGLGRLLSIKRGVSETAGAASGTERVTQAKRAIADMGKPETSISRKQDFVRNIVHTGNPETAVLRKAEYVKGIQETAGSTATAGIVRMMIVRLAEAAAALYAMKAGAGFNRGITDEAGIGSVMVGMALFFRVLFGMAEGGDRTGDFITRMRVIQDRGIVGDDMGRAVDYLRGLFVEAGVMAETKRKGAYYRKQQDTAYSDGVSLRQLCIFIRLLTGAYIRDYIIGRFLRSKEEIVIKSPVCREIVIDSRV